MSLDIANKILMTCVANELDLCYAYAHVSSARGVQSYAECNCTKIMHARYFRVFWVSSIQIGCSVRIKYITQNHYAVWSKVCNEVHTIGLNKPQFWQNIYLNVLKTNRVPAVTKLTYFVLVNDNTYSSVSISFEWIVSRLNTYLKPNQGLFLFVNSYIDITLNHMLSYSFFILASHILLMLSLL